jgi:hypothetical protein
MRQRPDPRRWRAHDAVATHLLEEMAVRKSWIGLALVAGIVAACSGSTATGAPAGGGTGAGATQAASQAAGASQTAGASASTGSSSGGAPTSPVACSLITTAAAKAALGEDVSDGTNPGIGENTCIFSGKPTYGIDFVQLTVINPDEFLPTQQSVPGSFTNTPASGIGDAAYYQKVELPNTGGESNISLSVKKGPTTFRVSIVHPRSPDAPITAGEKTLALAAVALI